MRVGRYCRGSNGILLLGLAVGTVTPAEAAVFAELQTVRRFLFIFLRIVVATFALGAGHHNHHSIFFFRHQSTTNMK
jgi:hypothetical protein